MIQTKLVIIATTLNTIRYSISLFHCLTGDEIGVSASGEQRAVNTPRTGMPPAIAIAARVRLNMAQ